MYKVRCSSLTTLLSSCGKINNKLEWTNLDAWNDTHIRLAIEIYNKENDLFTEAEVKTLDMSAGNELEADSVLLYDEVKGTNFYPDYIKSRINLLENNLRFEKSNEFTTGTRDFGNNVKTIDNKISTDKNVFDSKKFKPFEVDYAIAMNGYAWLYGTKELELCNVLMPATYGQIKKFVENKSYIDALGETERDEYQVLLETNYDYRLLDLEKRIDTKEIPLINNFEEIIAHRVKFMNKWIDNNKHRF